MLRTRSIRACLCASAVLLVACGRGVDGDAPRVDRTLPAEVARTPLTAGAAVEASFHVRLVPVPERRVVRSERVFADARRAPVVDEFAVPFVPTATGNADRWPSKAVLVAGRTSDGTCVVERWTPKPAGGAPEREELFRRPDSAWVTEVWPTSLDPDAFLARTFDAATGERALVLGRGGRAWKELFTDSELPVLGLDPLLLGHGDHAQAGHVHVFHTGDDSATWILADPSRTGEAFEVDVYQGAMPPAALLDPESYR